jgi:dipeptidyl aminopeptidase/acylaminoacyl peptidase
VRKGIVTGARFSPDGQTIYFSAAFGADPSYVYVTRRDSAESRRLDLPPAFLLSVSRRGELLVLLTEERAQGTANGTLARVPALGGTPRPLVDDVVDADWLPDGEQVAVLRGRTELRFELPPGKELFRYALHPRLSPDGARVAFVDTSGSGAAVELRELDGSRILRHELPLIWGLAWRPDGREIWFTGSESRGGTDRSLRALSLAGEERLLARSPGALNLFDVAPDGKSALVTTGSGWIGVGSMRLDRPGDERTFDLFGRSALVGLSADGGRILVDEEEETGRGAYLISRDDGAIVRLGDDRALGLSPDGAWALFYGRDDPTRIRLVPTGAGIAVELSAEPPLRPVDGSTAEWSRDGRRLFAWLHPPGEDPSSGRVYLRVGDAWRPVTPPGVFSYEVSPDGSLVAVRDLEGRVTLVPVDGGEPRSLDGEERLPIGWSPDGRWLHLRVPGTYPARIHRRELATGRVEPWREIVPADSAGALFVMRVHISDDGSTCAYSVLRVANQLFLADGLE